MVRGTRSSNASVGAKRVAFVVAKTPEVRLLTRCCVLLSEFALFENSLERHFKALMNKNSATALMRNISIDWAAGQHPIFRLVRPALVFACLYVLFIGLDSRLHGHNALFYVHIGSRFALHVPHGTPGYDGQFYYQIAHDPLHAAPFLDHPAYRYQRIVYALLVGALSLGQASLIPYMLLLVNFIAIVLGTELLARLLIKQQLSPWYSLAFGLYFGQATAFIFDTTEPLTYFFICLGLFLLTLRRPTAAALSMGLAVLSRETAILFPLGYLVLYLLQTRWQDALRRSEEHTSELQSHLNLVCRLLLEKKKKKYNSVRTEVGQARVPCIHEIQIVHIELD